MSGHIFISYARKDANVGAAPLDAALRTIYPVWRDTRGIDPVKDFTAEIESAIESARAVIVCVTEDVKRGDSFVRREIAYAEYMKKPILVARFADLPPPVNAFTQTWFDFFRGWDTAYEKLLGWLKGETVPISAPATPHTPSEHPLRPYVQRLYESANNHLQTAIIKLIDLDIRETPDVVPPQIDMFDMLFADAHSEQPFTSFDAAFRHYEQRTLLLGEPGAGKTVTLMATARQAAADWLGDSAAHRLPLLGVIATWDASKQPLIPDWLGSQRGANPEAVRTEMRAGRVLLFLDGLDELGGERLEKGPDGKDDRYDPRKRFIAALNAQLGTNGALVTCRIADYEAIGGQVALDGAVTLQALTDAQMRVYLAGDELEPIRTAIDADEDLRAMARTPLLLSYLAFAFRDRPEALRALKDLSQGALRDAIFTAYMDRRYERETKRLAKMGQMPPLTLEFIKETLGRLAMENAGQLSRKKPRDFMDRHVDNVLELQDFALILPLEQIELFVTFCVDLNFLLRRADKVGFPHLKLRDTLVFQFSIFRLRDEFLYTTVYQPNPASALAAIGDNRALESLIGLLQNDIASPLQRQCSARALGNLGNTLAVEPLIDTLNDFNREIRRSSVIALGQIGDVRALQPLQVMLHDVSLEVRVSATSALGSVGHISAVESLLQALNDRHSRVRRSAILALGRIGDTRAVLPLIHRLMDGNLWVRAAAADTLGRLRDKRAVRSLIRVLNDEEHTVRRSAARALGRLGDRRAEQWLIPKLSDTDASVRSSAAIALGKLGSFQAVKSLIQLLQDGTKPRWESNPVCASAAKALILIGTPEALEAVRAWREEDEKREES